MQIRKIVGGVALGTALLCGSCNESNFKEIPASHKRCPEPTPEVDSSNDLFPHIVKGGTRDDQEIYDAIACVGSSLRGDGTDAPCGSGTLITPNLLLTAQHLSQPDHRRGVSIHVKFGVRARHEWSQSVRAVRCWEFRSTIQGEKRLASCCRHVYPAKDSRPDIEQRYQNYLKTCEEPLQEGEFVTSDAAVWLLERRMTDITPIRAATHNPDGSRGQGYWEDKRTIFVGYGSNGADESCMSPKTPSGVRFYGTIDLDVPRDYSTIGGGRNGDYIRVKSAIRGRTGGPRPRTAPGDSGGPVLAKYEGGDWSTENCVSPDKLRVIATVTYACNDGFASTTYGPVGELLEGLLDPDGDGIHRGFEDASASGNIDVDQDGLASNTGNDNCPLIHNPDQLDRDGNGIGDACETAAN